MQCLCHKVNGRADICIRHRRKTKEVIYIHKGKPKLFRDVGHEFLYKC